MLSSINLNDKDYGQFIREAIGQLPIYNQEWTNYNASDPGITVLENLSAFTALQQSEINTVPEKVKWKLLALAGFFPREGRAAVEYVKPVRYLGGRGLGSEKIYARDLCYETAAGQSFINASITGIYMAPDARHRDRAEDISLLTGRHGVAGGVPIWGDIPREGACLYFLIDSIPKKHGTIQEIILCFNLNRKYNRNPFGEADENPFAEVSWELLTESGFEKLEAKDGTYCFLQNGYVMLSTGLAPDKLRYLEGHRAYCIRAVLTKAAYDIAPVVGRVAGLLTRVRQTDTLSRLAAVSREEELGACAGEALFQEGEVTVFSKAAEGFYRVEGHFSIKDAKAASSKENTARKLLGKGKAAPKELMVLCRDERILPYARLGMLYGYDEQEIELAPMHQVYSHGFSLLIRCSAKMAGDFMGREDVRLGQGEWFYHIVAPDKNGPDEVYYSVLEKENRIVVHDCGCFEGAEVFAGDYCIYQGYKGNVRAGTVFNGNGGAVFYNYAMGVSGRYKDTLEQVRSRFVRDLNTPATAVTAADCEYLVKNIPGLSISKVKAYAQEGTNRIHIAVRPNSGDSQPTLPDTYKNAIQKYMDERKLLSSCIIVEPPVYTAVNVHMSVRVKKVYTEIKSRIKEALDEHFRTAYADFGAVIYFHDIYEMLQGMDYIEEIYGLSLDAQNKAACKISGADIALAPNALCCAGECHIGRESPSWGG